MDHLVFEVGLAFITTISPSAIVAKVLMDFRRTAYPETEMILGITMFENVFLTVYLSIVSGIGLNINPFQFEGHHSPKNRNGFIPFRRNYSRNVEELRKRNRRSRKNSSQRNNLVKTA